MLFRLDLPYPPQTRQKIVICRTKRVVRIYKRIRRKVWETSYGHLIFRRAPREGHQKESQSVAVARKCKNGGGGLAVLISARWKQWVVEGSCFSAELCVSEW